MKALVYAAPKKMEVRDVAEPVAEEGKVRINVKYCGICGSDTGIFLGTHPRAKAPLVIGHEFVGTVEEDGKEIQERRFRNGLSSDQLRTLPCLPLRPVQCLQNPAPDRH